MSKKIPSLRSPLSRVRGLGSAGHGTEHWWLQRLTSLALIPLSLYVVASFFIYVVFGSYEGSIYWLRSPINAAFVILFILVGFHHAVSGLQVVIEDYIHCECAKIASLLLVKGLAVVFALLGVLSTGKILYGVFF
ncbi:MAG: succinate dehydrogenase, hydrophobic membrane anchor protein [Alphaproteobacteria bacterium]